MQAASILVSLKTASASSTLPNRQSLSGRFLLSNCSYAKYIPEGPWTRSAKLFLNSGSYQVGKYSATISGRQKVDIPPRKDSILCRDKARSRRLDKFSFPLSGWDVPLWATCRSQAQDLPLSHQKERNRPFWVPCVHRALPHSS